MGVHVTVCYCYVHFQSIVADFLEVISPWIQSCTHRVAVNLHAASDGHLSALPAEALILLSAPPGFGKGRYYNAQ
jgi:hypothetical protein